MSRPKFDVDPAVLKRALAMRAEGISWEKTAAHVGVGEHTLRRRLDPSFEARLSALRPQSFIRAGEHRVSKDEEARALAGVVPDTRTRHSRFMGDPLPGRSALDRRRVSPVINTIHTYGNKSGLAERIPSSGA